MGLFYDTKTVMVNHRIVGVGANNTGWNGYLWDVQ